MFNWFAPKIYHDDWLPEQNGHSIHFVEAGNPSGIPVLVFHGGPGGALSMRHTKVFGSRRFRIILFDQRGCGKSLPSGEIAHNTTADLIDDAKRLLDFLNVKEKVILFGGSWGSTLALLFAEKYPEKVDKLLLSKIFLADEVSLDWVEKISGWLYPDVMQTLREGVDDKQNLSDYYAEMINSDNLAAQVKAATLYGGYERVLGSLEPKLDIGVLDIEGLNSAKIYINYVARGFMLKPEQILQHTDKISHLPTLIVHNRLDMVCPLIGAYQLHQAMPNSKLVIVPEIGHVGSLLSKTINREIKKFLDF